MLLSFLIFASDPVSDFVGDTGLFCFTHFSYCYRFWLIVISGSLELVGNVFL